MTDSEGVVRCACGRPVNCGKEIKSKDKEIKALRERIAKLEGRER